MADPLAEIVTLLRPGAPYSKIVSAAGNWRIRRSEYGEPFYCAVLEGSCALAVDGFDAVVLEQGDFVLIPSADRFEMSSLEPSSFDTHPVRVTGDEFQLGQATGDHPMRSLIGYCEFASPDAELFVSLLPRFVHVRGEKRLATLVGLVRDESSDRRAGRDVILSHLLEILLIEAFRTTSHATPSPGLVRGLADERLAIVIRRMHEEPARSWTVAQLAKEAALSRSALFERFRRAVGIAPMDYLLAWRMALAKKILRENDIGIAAVAERVGYRSASTFTVAFTRHVGSSPARYARSHTQPMFNARPSRG